MKRKLESGNHEKFGGAMDTVKNEKKKEKKKTVKRRLRYAEEKRQHIKEEDEEQKIVKRRYYGDMESSYNKVMEVVEVDKNGAVLKMVVNSYAEAKKEQLEKKKKKKEEEGRRDRQLWEPRWSDANLAMFMWTAVCDRKGLQMHDYVVRNDYPNMTRDEINLDKLWRKVYKAEAEAEAAEASEDALEAAAEAAEDALEAAAIATS